MEEKNEDVTVRTVAASPLFAIDCWIVCVFVFRNVEIGTYICSFYALVRSIEASVAACALLSSVARLVSSLSGVGRGREITVVSVSHAGMVSMVGMSSDEWSRKKTAIYVFMYVVCFEGYSASDGWIADGWPRVISRLAP